VANWYDLKYAATQASLVAGFVGTAFWLIFGFRFMGELGRFNRRLLDGQPLLTKAGERYAKIALIGLAITLVGGFGLPLLIQRLP
jgi:hypothetical protein